MEANSGPSIELPPGWISLEIGEIPIYYFPETRVFSVTAPFSLTSLEYTYKKYFNKPLVINWDSIREQVDEFLKGSPQSPVKRLKTSPYKQKAEKPLKPVKGEPESQDKDPAIMERGSLSKFARKDIGLDDVKLNVNDVVSLFIQTWEIVLHFRPTIEFIDQKQKQRWIVKLKSELIWQVTLVGKKRSKHIAWDIAMRWTFPTLYKQWLEKHPNIKEDLQKIAEQHQIDHGGQKIYIGPDPSPLPIPPPPPPSQKPLPPHQADHSVPPIEPSSFQNPKNFEQKNNYHPDCHLKQEYIPQQEPYNPRNTSANIPEPEYDSRGYRYQNQRHSMKRGHTHDYNRSNEYSWKNNDLR